MLFLDKAIELNDTELDIYNYLTQNLNKAVYMRIRDLADAVHVSTTTIYAFVGNLNVVAFRNFVLNYKSMQRSRSKFRLTCLMKQHILTF